MSFKIYLCKLEENVEIASYLSDNRGQYISIDRSMDHIANGSKECKLNLNINFQKLKKR